MRTKAIFLTLLGTLVAGNTAALDLYVNNTGTPACSDATTRANNDADNPWCTFGRALWGNASETYRNTTTYASEAAQPGDVVTLSAGTYTATANTAVNAKYNAAFRPANNGTSGNYITFQAATSAIDASVAERTVLELSSGAGAVVGGFQRSYHKWIGFYIDHANAPSVSDTGPVVVWDSDYITVEGMEIVGETISRGDNYTGVRVEDATYVTIRNNEIYGFVDSAGNNKNDACIEGYHSQNITVENNEVYNCGSGIFPKGSGSVPYQNNWTIRYNLVYNCRAGIILGGVDDSDVYQNVIRDGTQSDDYAFMILAFSDPVPNNIDVYNNTIHNYRAGFIVFSDYAYSGNTFRNNIFSDASFRAIYWEVPNTTMYASANRQVFTNNYYDDNTAFGNVTWATWTGGTYGQDVNGSDGVDPGFVDEVNDDFRLDTGSAALTASDTSGPVGAYITGNETIGTGATASPSGQAATIGTGTTSFGLGTGTSTITLQ